MSGKFILDACALIAFLNDEDGAHKEVYRTMKMEGAMMGRWEGVKRLKMEAEKIRR